MTINELVNNIKKTAKVAVVALPMYGCGVEGTDSPFVGGNGENLPYLTQAEVGNSFQFSEDALSSDDNVGYASSLTLSGDEGYKAGIASFDAGRNVIELEDHPDFMDYDLQTRIVHPGLRLNPENSEYFYDPCENGMNWGDAVNSILDDYDGILLEHSQSGFLNPYIPTNVPFIGEENTVVPFDLSKPENCGY